MSQITIQTQIEALREVSHKAGKSKEAALKFLTEAGIVSKTGKSAERVVVPKSTRK